MNPMVKALDEIKFEIPPQILKAYFEKADFYLCTSPVNMDTRIREQVLDARVLVDMDIMGGTEVYIPLSSPVRFEQIDQFTVMYQIPDELTQNRPIRQIYSVHFGILGYSQASGVLRYPESALGGEMRKVLDSALRTPPASTSYINLINHNTFIVKYSYLPYSAAFIRCRLGNDEALNFIRPQSIPDFAELCVLATKAYIYNQYRIAIGQAYLSGGQELGEFKDAVMEYSDANEQYKAKLKVWKNISQNYNDPESRRRMLRTLVGAP
jgi:hypothetical protein